MKNWLYDYAMSFVGIRYSWSGSSPMSGYDCSGIVVELLEASGIIHEDMSAQGLFDTLSKKGTPNATDFGSIAFFGHGPGSISHCAFCLDEFSMLEAGGGGRLTSTVSDSIRDRAFVRIRPISHRKDLVAVIMPLYT